jgi:hypothetical protein
MTSWSATTSTGRDANCRQKKGPWVRTRPSMYWCTRSRGLLKAWPTTGRPLGRGRSASVRLADSAVAVAGCMASSLC